MTHNQAANLLILGIITLGASIVGPLGVFLDGKFKDKHINDTAALWGACGITFSVLIAFIAGIYMIVQAASHL